MDREELKQYLKENLMLELKVTTYPYSGSSNELIIKLEDEEMCRCNLHELSID